MIGKPNTTGHVLSISQRMEIMNYMTIEIITEQGQQQMLMKSSQNIWVWYIVIYCLSWPSRTILTTCCMWEHVGCSNFRLYTIADRAFGARNGYTQVLSHLVKVSCSEAKIYTLGLCQFYLQWTQWPSHQRISSWICCPPGWRVTTTSKLFPRIYSHGML